MAHALDPSTDALAVSWFRWSWGALAAGLAATFGIFALLLFIGAALGVLVWDPWSIARTQTPAWRMVIVIAALVVPVLLAVFAGAWLTGRLARVHSRMAALHGVVLWAAFALVTTVLYTIVVLPRFQPGELYFDSLNEAGFREFVLKRARDWQPGDAGIPVVAAPETVRAANPGDIPYDDRLRRFVQAETGWNERRTNAFLVANQDAIAVEQINARTRWLEQHPPEALEQYRQARDFDLAITWTVVALVILTLAASLTGSVLGHRSMVK